MIAHAAAISAHGTHDETHVLVLEAPGEFELLRLESQLRGVLGDWVEAFRELDPPYNGQLMSIGIEPVAWHYADPRTIRRFLKKFPLLK
jgi:hypothetical protein